MSDNNKFFSYLSKAVNGLYLNNQAKTSLGVLLGFVFDGVLPLLAPISLVALKLYHYIAGGIIIVHLRSLVAYTFSSPKRDEPVDKAFDLIEAIKKKTDVPEFKINQMYLKVVENYLESVTLNEKTAKQIKELRNEAIKGEMS